MTGCRQPVPPALQQEELCIDHYLDQAFSRLQTALGLCQQGRPLDPDLADWLRSNGASAVEALTRQGRSPSDAQRTKLLELLLCLANLQEYLQHHFVPVNQAE